ncbi:MAG TPA: TAT-variant-translocated molybdopterin oxidoreductase [Chitinophagales bacterium]|nr:TAT-variant-translocated molybdopterin oxidoreductase [Chitinophagales bacterium]
MSNKKYWTSLDELNNTPQYQESAAVEFKDATENDIAEEQSQGGTNRRDFLKVMGFSVSAAALASACKIPTHKAIPYTIDLRKQVPEVVPGVADYFASTFTDGTDFVNILVKTREGRPIKIEPNNDSPLGGTTAHSEASVLSVYDTTRLATPTQKNKKADWKSVDADVTQKLNAITTSGGKIAIVTGTITSVVTKKAIEKFVAKYPSTTVVAYDAVSNYATRKANQISLGAAIIPTIHFDKAEVIVGFNSDFIGTGISALSNVKKYIANRVPSKENPKMSRHHQFQSNVTITGSNADYKYPIKPSEEKQALINLYAEIGGSISGVKTLSGKDANDGIKKVAKELLAAKGKSVVISDTNDVDVQLLVNAINATLGNYGTVIDTANTSNLKAGNDEALAALANDLKAGAYKGIIFLNANPVYNTPYADIFKEAIKKAELSISTADRPDETAQFCTYVCPDNNYLESWDIISPVTGFYGFVQPAISPLFDTRQTAASLLTWAGDTTPIAEVVQAEVATITGANYRAAVQAGFYGSIGVAGGASANAASAIAALSTATASAASGLEVVFYEKSGVGDGSFANNPFLQEMPDPITKVTWDNYVCVPYSFAKEKGIDAQPAEKNVPIAKVTINGKTLELPVVVQFGQAQNTLAIAVGYGREKAGPAGDAVGKNVYTLLKAVNGATSFTTSGATFELTGKEYQLGLNQTYHTLMEDNALPMREKRYRGSIVKETTLSDYAKNEKSGNEDREHIKEHFSHSLYDGYKPNDYKQGHHWGMVVDLNACIGCGACVVACSIENNVPVVGRRQVYRSQEMHWLRIDRYYSGNPDNPDVAFQPMMCQHCNNAPCENVCPVNATNHSSDGLNQMAYNRCIGTRYCANNCPYKVRRFNWLDYQGVDSFGTFNDGKMSFTDTQAQSYMFEDLTRMVLNPDVVTRSRGVIEKCSFCIQRIQEGKLTAKKEGRPVKDGDIKSACQTACSTNAIIFGDQNDKESVVAKTFETNGRNYFVLEEQHFLPAVGYQVKVRNKDEQPAEFFIDKPEKA